MSMRTEGPPQPGRPIGIVVVSAAGIVESINAGAQAMLSQPLDEIIGRTITDVLSGIADETSLAALGLRFDPASRRKVNFGSPRRTPRLHARCESFPPGEGEERWLVLLKEGVDPPTALTSGTAHPRLAQRSRTSWFAAGSALTLLVATVLWGMERTVASTSTAPVEATAGASTPMTRDMAASPPAHISVVGTIEADDILGISAPFDGFIKERHLSFNTEVAQDQLVLVLAPADLIQRLQDAKVSLLKAGKALQELEHWERGTEVSRAKRAFELARQQVGQTEHKAQEIDGLVKKGILARSEHDIVAEQLNGLRSQLAAASDDLQATRDKASKGNLEIARIEHEQARAKYDELKNSSLKARIVAPRTGILSKVPASSGQTPTTLDVGSRITKGQLLFNVALTDKLRVSTRIDEADIVGLAPGMPVEVTIDSQDISPLHGRLAQISAQAIQNGNGIRSALFDVIVDLPELSEAQRKIIRVGMSCNIRIPSQTTANPAANMPAKTGLLQSHAGH